MPLFIWRSLLANGVSDDRSFRLLGIRTGILDEIGIANREFYLAYHPVLMVLVI